MDQPKKIILIEDDEFIRDIYQKELEKAGFPTDAFSRGQDGLQSLLKNHYDLLLLDIMLPDINGIEILKKIKQDSHFKDLKIVLLTNLGQDNIIKEAIALGANGYLIKLSYTPDQVINEVKNFLEVN